MNIDLLDKNKYLAAIIKKTVSISNDDDCWLQVKDILVLVDGIRMTEACQIIVYIAHSDYNPKKHDIRHLCHNDECCNINHLELVFRNLLEAPRIAGERRKSKGGKYPTPTRKSRSD